MPRCAIYARFSTDRQSANSAEDQVADCRARAEREGWEIAAVYTDVALSGTNNRRPGMTAMLADAAAGSFDIVLAEALDRIARNQADIATIYQRLEFADVAIETLSEGRVNELHIGLKGTMGALFLKDLAEKIRRGQRGTVSRGRVPGGLTYGYDVVAQIGANGELDRGLRRINPEQAEVIRRIYDEYLAGRSPKAIARDLNRDGIPAPRGGEWRQSSIIGSRARRLGVLYNPVYGGRYLYNRVRMVRDPESRKRLSRVNAAEDMVEVAMPELAIVSETVWQRVQDEADARSVGPMSQQVRPRHLLSGLVRCGRCGGSMTAIGGERIGCARFREAAMCDMGKTIRRPVLEQRVLAGLTEQLLSPQAVSAVVKRYHLEVAAQKGKRRETGAALDRRIAKVDHAIARLVAAIADGAADFREIRESLVARKAERQQLLLERDEGAAVPVIALNPDLPAAYRKRVKALALSLDSNRPESHEVRGRLRDLIEGVKLLPTNTGEWDIEVLYSLGGVVSLSSSGWVTNPGARRRSRQSAVLVAKEGLEPPTPGL